MGRGTLMRVCLPRVLERVADTHGEAPLSAGNGCVLVVDDDEKVRTTTGRLLESMGFLQKPYTRANPAEKLGAPRAAAASRRGPR